MSDYQLTLTLYGETEVIHELARRRDEVGEAIQWGIDAVATHILEQSNLLVPVLTGALRDSGQVKSEGHGMDAQAKITYGNELVDYAMPVHERLDVVHTNGTAKFLELAYISSVPQLQAIFVSAVREYLEL